MANSISKVPFPLNEPILSYSPESPEKKEVLAVYESLYKTPVEIPMRIGNKDVITGNIETLHPPHEYNHKLGSYHKANKENIKEAISSAYLISL